MKKYKLTLTFADKDLANNMWLALSKKQIGFAMEAETVEEKEYPIAFVRFESGPRYTYRVSEELYESMQKNPSERKRNWPTRYGLSYGEAVEIQRLTKQAIDKIYPFEKITTVK